MNSSLYYADFENATKTRIKYLMPDGVNYNYVSL